jgi:hypothetical protein
MTVRDARSSFRVVALFASLLRSRAQIDWTAVCVSQDSCVHNASKLLDASIVEDMFARIALLLVTFLSREIFTMIISPLP